MRRPLWGEPKVLTFGPINSGSDWLNSTARLIMAKFSRTCKGPAYNARRLRSKANCGCWQTADMACNTLVVTQMLDLTGFSRDSGANLLRPFVAAMSPCHFSKYRAWNPARFDTVTGGYEIEFGKPSNTVGGHPPPLCLRC